MNQTQKQLLADKVYDLTDDDVLVDFSRLQSLQCAYHKPLSNLGNDVVNKYTAVERLNTAGAQRMTFYDVWRARGTLKKIKPIQRMLDEYHRKQPLYPDEKIWYRIKNLYFSAVSIFRPLIAVDIYCRYKPKCVLDFTMGWGGRLVGACALNIPRYIGIDSNTALKAPYGHLTRFLQQHSSTEIDLYFQDALSIDYSVFEYDMVLTSPPYYNIEVYGSTPRDIHKDAWDHDFYEPIFTKTFRYLKKGGHYCINIPEEVYKRVARRVLGKPMTKIKLPKRKRFASEKYHEFIYVWKR
jgi:hypothetical protein